MQLLTYENAEAAPSFDDQSFWKRWQTQDGTVHYYTVADSEPGQAYLSWSVGQLEAGVYQLYVLDTHGWSGGEHAFQVRLGGVPVSPLRGVPKVIFASSQTSPQQQEAAWLSIGAYQVAYGQYMTVAADPTSLAHQYFAASQLLAIRLRESDVRILTGLPTGRPLVALLDDVHPKTREGAEWEAIDSPDAWNASYQVLAWDGTSPQELTFTWEGHGVLPPGHYELLVHLPPSAEDVRVRYDIFQGESEIKPETPREDSQGICREMANACSEGWVSWGVWEVKKEGGLSVRLTALGPGRIVVDAVALVRVDEEDGS